MQTITGVLVRGGDLESCEEKTKDISVVCAKEPGVTKFQNDRKGCFQEPWRE